MKKKLSATIFALFFVFLFGCNSQQDGTDNEPKNVDLSRMILPGNSTLVSAEFYIRVSLPNSQIVNIHRITNDWNELTATWNSFNGSYATDIIGSFTADSIGWKSIDITALVQGWLNGDYPNYGILLKQDEHYIESPAKYISKDSDDFHPFIYVTYKTADGTTTSVEEDVSEDTFIWERNPDSIFGDGDFWNRVLYTGWQECDDFERQALVKFSIEKEVITSSGTGTPGYWKNHPDAWPVNEIWIGGVEYSKADAITILSSPVKGDKTINMFYDLVASKLNILIGNDSSCIDDTITNADEWLVSNPLGSSVRAKSDAWQIGESFHSMLDNYNNGLLCAQHRD